MSTPEQNQAQTILTARKKIAQLGDASDKGDLIYRFGVASGWISALRLEGLLGVAVFEMLHSELLDAFTEVGRNFQDESPQVGQFDKTLVERARAHLGSVCAFYAKAKAGTAVEDDRREYQKNHAAMNALLELAHWRDSGLSEAGRKALLAVEVDAAAAFRDYCS